MGPDTPMNQSCGLPSLLLKAFMLLTHSWIWYIYSMKATNAGSAVFHAVSPQHALPAHMPVQHKVPRGGIQDIYHTMVLMNSGVRANHTKRHQSKQNQPQKVLQTTEFVKSKRLTRSDTHNSETVMLWTSAPWRWVIADLDKN
eukprot:3381350-Amphidinium_carterae.1